MPNMYAKVIVNPAAGGKATYHRWPEIQRCLHYGGLPFDFQYTEGPGHAIALARMAAIDGYRCLVAVGGDGTINEVANGILAAGCAGEAASLGIVGTGTGNDLIRSLGVPRDYANACYHITTNYKGYAASSNGTQVRIDVGLVEYTVDGVRRERYFVNGAGVGFDAEVVGAAASMPRHFGRTTPFVMGILRTLPTYRNKQVRIIIDGKIEERFVLSVIVSNGAYFGGGMKIAPEALPCDSRLDVVAIGDVDKLELLRIFPRVYKGTHVSHPKVTIETAEAVVIASQEHLLLQADGEVLGEGPVSFRVVPQALCLAF